MSEGKLFVVPTPIGNLGDLTFRAVEVLKAVDGILAEDTRQTAKLLNHYDIQNSMSPFHMRNEHKVQKQVIDQLSSGKQLALCTDAGTPGISDPGFLLIRSCYAANIPVEVLPGANALTTAVVASGLPCDRFVFEGFLPHKKGKQTMILSLLEQERTTVFYESPHRIAKTLAMMQELLGNERLVVVARELTKKFEEIIRGDLKSVNAHFEQEEARGEMVLIVAGKNYHE